MSKHAYGNGECFNSATTGGVTTKSNECPMFLIEQYGGNANNLARKGRTNAIVKHKSQLKQKSISDSMAASLSLWFYYIVPNAGSGFES